MEKTFIMIKPDGVRRNLVGEIIRRIESKGLEINRMKMIEPDLATVEAHYDEHRDKPFFGELVEFISGGRVVALEVEGEMAVLIMRNIIGHKSPSVAAPGTIRGDYAYSTTENLVHGSDSESSAQREIELWFGDE